MSDEEEKNKLEEETGENEEEEKGKKKSRKEEALELVDKQEKTAERIEKANAETKELMEKRETLDAENQLAGTADAGQKKKEDTPEEYSKKVLSGEIDGTENKRA